MTPPPKKADMTDSAAVVAELRLYNDGLPGSSMRRISDLCQQAAALIERLSADVGEAREALGHMRDLIDAEMGFTDRLIDRMAEYDEDLDQMDQDERTKRLVTINHALDKADQVLGPFNPNRSPPPPQEETGTGCRHCYQGAEILEGGKHVYFDSATGEVVTVPCTSRKG